MEKVDFRTSNDPAAQGLFALLSTALQYITPVELAALVEGQLQGNQALTASQKLGVKLLVRELSRGTPGSDLVNEILQACLYASFADAGAGEAEPLVPAQREGFLVLVGTIAKGVVAAKAAELQQLAGKAVGVPAGWAAA